MGRTGTTAPHFCPYKNPLLAVLSYVNAVLLADTSVCAGHRGWHLQQPLTCTQMQFSLFDFSSQLPGRCLQARRSSPKDRAAHNVGHTLNSGFVLAKQSHSGFQVPWSSAYPVLCAPKQRAHGPGTATRHNATPWAQCCDASREVSTVGPQRARLQLLVGAADRSAGNAGWQQAQLSWHQAGFCCFAKGKARSQHQCCRHLHLNLLRLQLNPICLQLLCAHQQQWADLLLQMEL